MKFFKCLIGFFAVTGALVCEETEQVGPLYYMVTASIVDGEVEFDSEQDFNEAMKVGFFRIEAPQDLNLAAGRTFAKTFTSNARYNQFGALNVVNGYLSSETAQTVRFTLERDNWNKCHVEQQEVEGPPNYSPELQEVGHQISNIGVKILQSILRRHGLPEELWFEATAGCAHGEGSHFFLFNCYDPGLGSRAYGVGAHKDWGFVSLVDATEPGLEAKIDGVWRGLYVEDGYLVVNFGYSMEKLLPGVTASEHRVVTQTKKMRTSTVMFVDPRVGTYRNPVSVGQNEGYVYDWDPAQKKLINGEPTTTFFARLSAKLYGKNQSSKS